MSKNKRPSIRLKSISIENYKGIDSFKMDLPRPSLAEDPDILVMGSENGLGKTSIIECCALLLMGMSVKEKHFDLGQEYLSIDAPDLLIRAGTEAAKITGFILIDKKECRVKIQIDRNGTATVSNNTKETQLLNDVAVQDNSDFSKLITAISGFSANPVIENSFLLFHSYRKIQEGNPELGMMVDNSRIIRRMPSSYRYRGTFNEFKILILRSLMLKAGLFEFARGKEPEEDPEDTIDKLNELVGSYAGGRISKLKPSTDNTVGFRITPVKGSSESFTLDGLSSGQKEIISTLFLIWYHTRNNPSVVFVDEPELHLNAQWHRTFVNNLLKLAPENQYIIATHSEDIMDSVYKEHRILLLKDKENTND